MISPYTRLLVIINPQHVLVMRIEQIRQRGPARGAKEVHTVPENKADVNRDT